MTAARRLASLLVLLAPAFAGANERHFTYTYESATLPPGHKEIEIWSTPRIGRDSYFYRIDQRVEFEVGILDRWQASLYLNGMVQTSEVMPGVLESETELQGISIENKIKLLDPVADAVGLALYAEVGLGADETELEAKLILDKRLGSVHLAANLVGELELEAEGAAGMEVEMEKDIILEADLGASYFVASNFGIGAELRNRNVLHDGELEYSALFAGPVVSYATDDWWLAFTFFAQLPSLGGDISGDRVLTEHEKIEARLLVSFHL